MLNLTNFQPFLKTLWPQKRVHNLFYKDQPLLAMIRKDTEFYGDGAYIALQYGNPQGRSASIAKAITNAGNLAGVRFNITRKKDYAVAKVDRETMKASASNEGALAKAWDREVKGAVEQLKRSLGGALFGNGSGSLGRRSGALSGNVLTLTDIRQIVNFEVGMKISAGPNDSATGLRAGTAATISGVNRRTGEITATDWANITSFAASDYLFVEGDAGAKVTGLAGWLPPTDPAAAENFKGVDRSVDSVRLAGNRIDISNMRPSEGLVNAANIVGLNGGAPEYMFCHFEQLSQIANDLGAKVQYEELRVGEIGFEALKVNGPKGTIRVIADINCPYDKAYLLQMETLCLYSLGEVPQILDDDTKMLREATEDAYQVRYGYYAEAYCDAPGFNAVLTMPT